MDRRLIAAFQLRPSLVPPPTIQVGPFEEKEEEEDVDSRDMVEAPSCYLPWNRP